MVARSSPRHVRIFLSSPGDVSDERALSCKIIDDLVLDPLLRERAVVRSVAWDSLSSRTPMLATLTPQEAINRRLPKPSECDIVVVLFWSRMGTPLPFPDYQKPDGQPYQAGTEWEYWDAVWGAKKHPHGLPLVVVYRRTEKVLLDPDDPKFDEKREQYQRVKDFFAQFTDASGVIRGGCNSYESPDNFRQLFEIDVRELIATVLETPLVGSPTPPPPVVETLWTGSPFPGLRAFTPADAPIFFGRGRETDALIKRVGESRFVAVVGASGSGKSSLVGAGLIPRLQDNALPGSKDWRWARFTPGRLGRDSSPFLALAAALEPLLSSRGWQQPDHLAAELAADPTALGTLCEQALDGAPEWAELLLFIDQFEELFTTTHPQHGAAFAELLACAANTARLRIVATLRADFYHRCLAYKPLEELLRAGSFPLGAPGQIALGEMITRPAERAGLRWEDTALPEQILQDTGSEPGALALMAYTLDELYQTCHRADGRVLSHAAYDDLGGVQGAIGARAEKVFAGLDDEAQAVLPQVFRELVEVDERGTATRQRAPLATFEADAAAGRLIHSFTEARLLTTGGDGAEAVVEVAHEALFRSWTRLASWIDEAQADLFLLREMRKAARAWDEHARHPDYLLLGERGQDVQGMLARLKPKLDDVERAFARPEQDHLLERIRDIDTPHPRRSEISFRLHELGDPRSGIGLRPDGLPDLEWCFVPAEDGAHIEIEGKNFPVQPFYIARYLVTYAQFQAFVEQDYQNPDWWDAMPGEYQRQEVGAVSQRYSNYPRDTVSWYQAVAFCRWLSAKLPAEAWPEPAALEVPSAARTGIGRLFSRAQPAARWEIRLPTEWEWQWAAQNGPEGRAYPWQGGSWDDRRCNTSEAGVGHSTAVGLYPPGAAACGALDMAGNLWEWCLNKRGQPEETAVDASGDARDLRGGSWGSNQLFARAAYRFNDLPLNRFFDDGFRVVCARPPSL